MKFYVASRFQEKARAREIIERLQSVGHDVTFDWTVHEKNGRYLDDIDRATHFAHEDMQGVLDADILVVVAEHSDGGRGMYVELGIALGSAIQKKHPRIYILGEENDLCIFYFHSLVKRVDTIDDVLLDLVSCTYD